MNNIPRLLAFILAVIFIPSLSKAQLIKNYQKSGDRNFDHEAYYSAAINYQKAFNLLTDSAGGEKFLPYANTPDRKKKEQEKVGKFQYLVYRLGESYRLYKDFKSAEPWYAKAVKFDNDKYPLARLWYGVCLRADQKYQKAGRELQTFLTSYTEKDSYYKRAQLELKSCTYALTQIKHPKFVRVKKIPAPIDVDSGSNYAPVRIADTLYFTSSRPLDGVNPKKHSPYINKLYYSVIHSNGSYSKPELMKSAKQLLTETAAASFSPNRGYLYFTKWLPGGKKRNEGRYVIVKSKRDDNGEIQPAIVLGTAVNVEGYTSKEASITPDGNYLTFSSNRPGGSGGFDLWYCKLNEIGMPEGEAVNLGPIINTSGDEVSPYYDDKAGALIFSTDYRVGIGGFDLFMSRGNFKSNQWTTPKNLGYPINSSKDDLYYYPLGQEEGFYTSSDRNSVCCLDLYEVKPRYLKIVGHVYDSTMRQLLPNIKIVLTDSIRQSVLGSLTTQTDGYFQFQLNNRRSLKLHVSNEKYGEKSIIIPHLSLQKVDSVYHRDVYLTRYVLNKPIVIRNVYYDFDKASLRARSKLALDTLFNLLQNNQTWIVEIGSHTDSIGSSSYNEWLSQQRAQSVVNYLIEKGINKNRLVARGYGERNPIAPNSKPDGTDNPEGRQLNRRTEFRIIGFYHKNGSKHKKELYESVVGDTNNIKTDYGHKLWMSRRRHLTK